MIYIIKMKRLVFLVLLVALNKAITTRDLKYLESTVTGEIDGEKQTSSGLLGALFDV